MNDLTQPEMQAAIDVEGKGKWSDWERGKSHPSYEDLKKISDYFRLKADELLYHDLSIVHPNKNEVESKTGADVHLNVHPSVHLKAENEQFPLN